MVWYYYVMVLLLLLLLWYYYGLLWYYYGMLWYVINCRCVQFCVLNVRSIKNKAMAVRDLVVDQDIGILALTETWLRPGNIDDVEIRTLCPTGYRFLHVPRGHSRGGGVGLLFKDTLQTNSHITDTFTTFELMDIHFRSLKSIRVQLIYRPPDNISCVLFLEEFSVLLEQIMAESTGHLLIIYLVTSIYMLMTPVASMQSALMKFLNHAT